MIFSAKKYIKFLIVGLIVIFLSSTVFAGSLNDIYTEISNKYPDDIQKMKDNGATEENIRDFLNSIEDELQGEELTDDNAGEIVSNVILVMYLNDEHSEVFDAVIKGWGLTPDTLIDAYTSGGSGEVYELLPQSLREIGSVVKKRLTSNDDRDSDGGGSRRDTEQTSAEPNYADSEEIAQQIAEDLSMVALSFADDENALNIKAQDFNRIAAAGKELQLRDSEGIVTLTIAPGTLQPEEGSLVRFRIERISEEELQSLAPNSEESGRIVGNVYDISFSMEDAEGNSADITPDRPMRLAMSYAGEEVTEDEENKLVVFWYNEDESVWELIGGKVNRNKQTVEWDAEHYSKYALMLVDKTFSDIAEHWARQDIEYLAARELVNGVSEKEFEPHRDITRAEFTKMLCQVLKLESQSDLDTEFTDIPENAWYRDSVLTAFNAGLVNGVSVTRFEPNRNITRQEMAAMIARALDYKEIDTEMTEEAVNSLLLKFDDSMQIADWAKKSLAVTINAGIIGGRTEAGLAPAANTNRAEAAVMIKRFFDIL